MRYDAKTFLLSRWRQNYGQPTGTNARDFVGFRAGDPRHMFSQHVRPSRVNVFSPRNWPSCSPLSGTAPFSAGEGTK